MRHAGGGEQRKMSFLKQIMCRGTGCQGAGNSRRVCALFPAGHDGGRSWSAEGGLPRQKGECSGSPPCGSAPAWKQLLGRDRSEAGLMAHGKGACGVLARMGLLPAPGKGAPPHLCRYLPGELHGLQLFTTHPQPFPCWLFCRGR